MKSIYIAATVLIFALVLWDHNLRNINEKHLKETSETIHDLNLRLDTVQEFFHKKHIEDSIIIAEIDALDQLDSIKLYYKKIPSITEILKRINSLQEKINNCQFSDIKRDTIKFCWQDGKGLIIPTTVKSFTKNTMGE